VTTGPVIFHCTAEFQSSSLTCCSKKDSNLILVLDPSLPMPVAALTKACVCGRLLAGIVGLNPAGGMYLLCVVCSEVEVSASGRSLIRRCPTECVVSERDREATIKRRPWPTGGCCVTQKNNKPLFNVFSCVRESYVRV